MIFVCTAKTFCRNELRKGMLYTNFITQLRAAFFPIKSLSTAVTAETAAAAAAAAIGSFIGCDKS